MNRLTMFELNEKYKDYPTYEHTYEIDKKKFVVHSHFIGEKDINEVISKIAVNRAMSEILKNVA